MDLEIFILRDCGHYESLKKSNHFLIHINVIMREKCGGGFIFMALHLVKHMTIPEDSLFMLRSVTRASTRCGMPFCFFQGFNFTDAPNILEYFLFHINSRGYYTI